MSKHAGTPKDYYKRALTIPLLDHLISEIDTYFDPNNDTVMSSLLCLLPALLVSREGNPVQAAFQYYADDLPSHQVFDVELFRWRRKWLNADEDHLPSSAAQALEECNHELFPNVHKLLRILCTFRPLSHGGHFDILSPRRTKSSFFCPSSLALDERLDGQNLLFQQSGDKVLLPLQNVSDRSAHCSD